MGLVENSMCARNLNISDRQNDILAAARSQGRVSVDSMASSFAVTPQTIRRDLNELCHRGLLARVHGGAMPQEVIVPLIRVRQLKGKTADKTKTSTVGVSVLGSNFKVTTNRHRFKLIQTKAVGERVKPVTLKVAIYEGEQPVTNVETLTFDSASSDMNEWQKIVNLTLESREYDKQTIYQLVLRDAETGVDEARFDVTIDLAFTNDF